MRITILTQFYAPEPDLLHGPARELARFGHSVEVVTAIPSYPLGRVYDGYRPTRIVREEMDGVKVLRLPSIPDHSASILRRGAQLASFALSVALYARSRVAACDVLLVQQPPSTLILPALILARGAPIVWLIKDLWPDTLEATSFVRSRSLLRLAGLIERFAQRRAAAIITVSQGARARVLARGIPADRVHVVFNSWYEASRPGSAPFSRPTTPLVDRGDGVFQVVYAGNLGPAQGLDVLLGAADRLRALADVRFLVAGSGIEGARLEAETAARRLDNLRFLGRLPAEEMSELYASADALIVCLADQPLLAATIPAKLQSALAAGRPVIGSLDGDAARLVQDAGAGRVSRPGDAEALANAIVEMKNTPTDARRAMGESGRRYAEAHFAPPAVARAYEAVLLATVGRG